MLQKLFEKWWGEPEGPALPPAIPEGIRLYAIGDIHGRADLLRRMFQAIDRDRADHPAGTSIEVYLGDYVDRGADSRGVIDLLIARREGAAEHVFLKGNHEQTLLAFLSDPTVLTGWRNHGGYECLMSYGVSPPAIIERETAASCSCDLKRALPESHFRFLSHLGVSFELGDYFFAHAGIRPGLGIDEQSEEDLLWIRGEFLESREDFGKVVVHGHTPVHQPEVLENRINLDTGAFATGRLTCLILEGETQSLLTA